MVWLELECATQLPNVLVLCVLAHDKLPRQVERKMLTCAPIVGTPLEKKHIRVFQLEYASLRPQVSVEIEKRLTAVGQIEVTLMQTSGAQKSLEFLARIQRVKHRMSHPVCCWV